MKTSTRTSAIGESTGVTIGLVVGLFSIGGAAIWWGSAIDAATARNRDDIKDNREHREEYERRVADGLEALKSNVSVIDTRLTILSEYVARSIEEEEKSGKRKPRKGVWP